MTTCLLCASPRTIGALCTGHGVAIASPGLTSEQIFSRVEQPAARAALVDAWGAPHWIRDGSKIGRGPTDVAVLHASVSNEHATIGLVGDQWRVTDHASRNGVDVDGVRVTEVALRAGAILQLGDVKLYFWPEPTRAVEAPRGSGRTAPARRDDLVFTAKVATPSGKLFELRQRVEGGTVRIGEASLELAGMEFGLLQLLVERRRAVSDPELAYVAWHELADALTFRSTHADSENVRELVHRVRQKLASVASEHLIESKRGVGYRLAGELE